MTMKEKRTETMTAKRRQIRIPKWDLSEINVPGLDPLAIEAYLDACSMLLVEERIARAFERYIFPCDWKLLTSNGNPVSFSDEEAWDYFTTSEVVNPAEYFEELIEMSKSLKDRMKNCPDWEPDAVFFRRKAVEIVFNEFCVVDYLAED